MLSFEIIDVKIFTFSILKNKIKIENIFPITSFLFGRYGLQLNQYFLFFPFKYYQTLDDFRSSYSSVHANFKLDVDGSNSIRTILV